MPFGRKEWQMKIHTTLVTADPGTYDVHIETDGDAVYLRLVAEAKSWESRMTAEEAGNVAAALPLDAECAAPADLDEE